MEASKKLHGLDSSSQVGDVNMHINQIKRTLMWWLHQCDSDDVMTMKYICHYLAVMSMASAETITLSRQEILEAN